MLHARPVAAVVGGLAAALVLTGPVGVTGSSNASTGNLVVNPGFESDTSSWYASSNATLSRAPGYVGSYSARVTSTAVGQVVLNDGPDTVQSAVKGDAYTLSAWVRTSAPSTAINLRVKEYSTTGAVGEGVATVTPQDTAWHKISVRYIAKQSGTKMGINVFADQTATNRSFDVDEVNLIQAAQWTRIYRHDFTSQADVTAYESGVAANDEIAGSDTDAKILQRPTLKSNVAVVDDSAAGDGKALAVHTRKGNYSTSSGTKYGWTNGRMQISNHEVAPPVRVRARIKMTASVKAKSAVMWWPTDGWPWEVDFAETFGGSSLTDYWGSRQYVGQRWHADLDGDGDAKEQLEHDDKVDATKYHIYDLFVASDRMWIEIDGVKRFETTDRRYIPTGTGHFSIGKALTHRRDAADRTNDTVFADWVEIYKG